MLGTPYELVDRFLGLIDQDFADLPDGRTDLMVLVAYWLSPLVDPNDLSEDEYIAMLRERLRELIDDGVQEEFLIQSLLLALDRFMERQGDSRLHSDQGDRFREFIQRCIDDPDQRHSYRTTLASQGTTYEDDEAFVTDLRRVLEEHPLARQPSVESEATRWTFTERWREQRETLSDGMVERWGTRRAAQDRRRRHKR